MNPQAIRERLQGKKTYGLLAIGFLYLLGVWAGWWEWDAKFLGAIGLGGLWTLGLRVNRLLAQPKPPPDLTPPKPFPSDRAGDN